MLIVGLGDCRRLGMKAPSSNAYLALNNILARLKAIGCTGLSFGASDKRIKFDAKFIKTITDAGYRLVKMGATSVVTDRPTTMKQAWEKLFGSSPVK